MCVFGGFYLKICWQKIVYTHFDTGNLEYVSTVFVLFTDLISFCLDGCQVRARRSTRLQPQPSIYEEMVGVQSPSQKLAPLHLDKGEYKNCSVRKTTAENHYESPSSVLVLRNESQK